MQPIEQERPGRDYLTIAQIIISGLGLILALLGAGLLLVAGLAALFSEALDLTAAASLFSMAWVSGLLAVLTLPSVVYSFRRIKGERTLPPQPGRLRLASLLLLVWPLVLVIGDQIVFQSSLVWLFLPPLHLLAVGLPVWWLVELARHKLTAGSRQREWGVLNVSLLVTMPAVVAAEITVFSSLLFLFAVWLNGRPEMVTQLKILIMRFLSLQPNPETIWQLTWPFLQNPLVFFSILAILAGMIPLLEELLKPLALWALAGRRLTPPEGFAAGALCGGAFALLESLLSLAGPLQDGWAFLAIGRAGTALLHITTTALVGWALANAWETGSYIRLGLTYLLSAGLHGLWNALSVLSGLGAQVENPPESMRFLIGLSQSAPAGIIVLGLALFFLLWGGNRMMRAPHPQTTPASDGLDNHDMIQSN